MRLDKFLKVSRLIKRRTIANKFCAAKKVCLNGKIAKASSEVKVNDVLEINSQNNSVKVRILKIKEFYGKDCAHEMYEVI